MAGLGGLTHEERIRTDPVYAADARTERQRIGAVIDHGVSIGQYDLAKSLALETDLDAEAAIRVLDRMPAPAAAPTAKVAVPATDFALAFRAQPRAGEEDDTDDLCGMLARTRTRERRP
jgi:hypothetical protein